MKKNNKTGYFEINTFIWPQVKLYIEIDNRKRNNSVEKEGRERIFLDLNKFSEHEETKSRNAPKATF